MKNRKKQRGFTLPEIVIGITVLLIAILTSTNLMVSITRSNKVNMNDLAAYYLAAEAVEGVRNIRDTQWLNNLKWTGDSKYDFWAGSGAVALDFSEAKNGSYILSRKVLDANITHLAAASSSFDSKHVKANAPWLINRVSKGDLDNGAAQLVLAGKSHQLVHSKHLPLLSSGLVEKSRFSRHIVVELLTDSKMKVDAIVNWDESGRDREVRISTILTNWKGGAG